MANQEHLDILEQGMNTWNQWRQEHPEIEPDLSCADLSWKKFTTPTLQTSEENVVGYNFSKANFKEVDLSYAELHGADLSETNLENANFYRCEAFLANFFMANLRNANLTRIGFAGCSLDGVDFQDANLAGGEIVASDVTYADFRGANLTGAEFIQSDLSYANFRDTKFQLATLVEVNLSHADLTGSNIFGISVWNVQLEDAIQSNLVITNPNAGEPTIIVDNIDVAQFIYLLLNNQKIRQTIDSITSHMVLILSSFLPGRKEIIEALSAELRRRNYSPVVFNMEQCVFEEAENKNVTTTVRTLANMARFVLLDLTHGDDAIREIADSIVPYCVVPIRPLLLQGSQGQEYELFQKLQRTYRWVLKPYRYKDLADLQSSFQEKILQPIQERIIELEQKKPIKMFLGYAPEDERMLIDLKKHLILLERSGQIKMWDDREIKPGEEREKDIERHLSEARIILLLISPDFIASDVCQAIQERAIERYEQGEARVIPILLRPCPWQATPLKELQPLPKDEKPIYNHNKDQVFFAVSEGIGEVIKSLG